MFNLNALMKFINVNDDKYIQKSEINQFIKKLESPSIFNDYLNSISNDTYVETVVNGIMEIIKNTQNGNKEIPDFEFKYSFEKNLKKKPDAYSAERGNKTPTQLLPLP